MSLYLESKKALNVINYNKKCRHNSVNSNGFVLPSPMKKNCKNSDKIINRKKRKNKYYNFKSSIKNVPELCRSNSELNIVFDVIDGNNITVNVNKHELDNLVIKKYQYWYNITNGIIGNNKSNSKCQNNRCNNDVKLKKYKKRIYTPK